METPVHDKIYHGGEDHEDKSERIQMFELWGRNPPTIGSAANNLL